MLASRCVPPAGAWNQFHSRAGTRLVLACAAVAAGTAQAGVAFGVSSSLRRAAAAAAGAPGSSAGRKGGRALRKGELPTKTCATCGLPFEYRSKWAKVWDEVKYCSDRCRGARRKSGGGADNGAQGA